jgi:hypothetical protein
MDGLPQLTPAGWLALQQRIADEAAIADIETACPQGQARDDVYELRWRDTRPMLDPREAPNAVLDMAERTLMYAEWRGLIVRCPGHPHLVRITKAGP